MTTDEARALLLEMRMLRDVLARLDARLRDLDVKLAPAQAPRCVVSREQILAALDRKKGNVSAAARLLQIHRKQLQRLMIAYELRDADPNHVPGQTPRAPVTREQVVAALDRKKGNVSHAAKLLLIHRRQLQRYMVKYGLRGLRHNPAPAPPAASREP